LKKLIGSDLTVEFPLNKEYRERCAFSDKDFSLRGHLMIHSQADSRNKEHQLRSDLTQLEGKENNISTGSFFGTALLHTFYRHILRKYSRELLPQLWTSLDRSLKQIIPVQELDLLYKEILESYPSNPIFHGQLKSELLLQDPEMGDNWKQLVLEQIFLLRLAFENPAIKPLQFLINHKSWEENALFKRAADRLEYELEGLPVYGKEQKVISKLMRCPMEFSDNLQEQLRYIRENWGDMLDDLLPYLLEGMDLLAEENQLRIPGPGPAEGVDFSLLEEDFARYSPDSSWMPSVVLLAKNALVWLYQLSRKYERPISNLAEIPDEELDFLAECGFTGLWLIGLWERSKASREIKKRCGNPEAEASAYSLFSYEISHRLGGNSALQNLKERCLYRGIRLASDMVPNHTGIDSEWMRHHPEWFIQRSDSPYPQYSYKGENLSNDPEVDLFLEDHYYDRTDCAVTFKRVDKRSGNISYIYHGNDGTSMPWNDTAQIDFLNPHAREAVIGQILNVARDFPIIRFDAAMVLARKHIRRLWYPRPGEGGAIPSRSEFALSEKDFHEALPEEFWREVVQRVSEECPDTLLLAEAFWMMEGYFVRNLGMHRVYNSAFMNMVKNEKNDEFRREIKKTLDYDPEILKRFVNFMSNPDEDTADAQFGRHDKYFGVLALMLTLPGLPMIGHGQLEGYREKYGMEYSRAYYDETPDWELMERHKREIFPIMKDRKLFSDAAFFHLYDAWNHNGSIEESVYAYSNIYNQHFSLFLFNNRIEEVQGSIHQAYGKNYGLAQALGLNGHTDFGQFVIFHEHRSGLWFIRRGEDLHKEGLYFRLSGYEYQLFTRFTQINDTPDRVYQAIWNDLQGQGIESLEQAVQDYRLRPLFNILGTVFNQKNLQQLCGSLLRKEYSLPLFARDKKQLTLWFQRIAKRLRIKPRKGIEKRFIKRIRKAQSSWRNLYHFHRKQVPSDLMVKEESAMLMALWIFLQSFAELSGKKESDLLYEWDILHQLDIRKKEGEVVSLPFNAASLLEGFSSYSLWYRSKDPLKKLCTLFDEEQFQKLCGVNLYDQILWFNQQGFENITGWLLILARMDLQGHPLRHLFRGLKLWQTRDSWMELYEESEFRVQHMRTCHHH